MIDDADMTVDDRFHTGTRLHAARLLAGYHSASSLALAWALKDPTYRAIEKGRRKIRPDIVENAVVDLGISPGFLLDGVAVNERDEAASALAPLLARYQREGYKGGSAGAAYRLLRLRHAAGFRFASAAANEKGWRPATYIDHESRRRNMPVDLAVTYALGFGAPVTMLLFDEGLGASGSMIYSRMSSNEISPPPQEQWSWLNRSHSDGRFFHLPVLGLGGSRLRLEEEDFMLPSRWVDLPRHDESYFAVAISRSKLRQIYIMSAIATPRKKVLVLSGRELHETREYANVKFQDPLSADGVLRPQIVGTIMFTLMIRDERQ